MQRHIGVLAAEHLAVGLVEGARVVGSLRVYPSESAQAQIQVMPAEDIGNAIRAEVELVGRGEAVQAIGVGFPGIIRDGVIEDSPNLQQTKGFNLQAVLSSALRQDDRPVPAFVFNDADVMAAGIAATQGHLDKLVRVWTLGHGIGFGRYPWAEGVWEGGHTVVTLDPKEKFCGCGGVGHLEGIMGHRAMRLRFLDLEPEEIFDNAQRGDSRCAQFVTRWHRALAAATATSIHLEGPGKFFVTGPNARFIDANLLDNFLHEMVKMSPLQGSLFEVIATSDEIGIIGAAVNAARGIRLVEKSVERD
jgi:glucokinase